MRVPVRKTTCLIFSHFRNNFIRAVPVPTSDLLFSPYSLYCVLVAFVIYSISFRNKLPDSYYHGIQIVMCSINCLSDVCVTFFSLCWIYRPNLPHALVILCLLCTLLELKLLASSVIHVYVPGVTLLIEFSSSKATYCIVVTYLLNMTSMHDAF